MFKISKRTLIAIIVLTSILFYFFAWGKTISHTTETLNEDIYSGYFQKNGRSKNIVKAWSKVLVEATYIIKINISGHKSKKAFKSFNEKIISNEKQINSPLIKQIYEELFNQLVFQSIDKQKLITLCAAWALLNADVDLIDGIKVADMCTNTHGEHDVFQTIIDEVDVISKQFASKGNWVMASPYLHALTTSVLRLKSSLSPGQLHIWIGHKETKLRNNIKAMNHYAKGLEFCQKINDYVCIEIALSSQALTLSKLNKLHEAIDVYKKAITINEKTQNKANYIRNMSFIGQAFFLIKEYEVAKTYLTKVLIEKPSRKQSEKDLASAREALGYTLIATSEIEIAILELTKASKQYEKLRMQGKANSITQDYILKLKKQ